MMPRLEIVGRKKFFGFFFKTTYKLLEDYVYTCPETGRTLTSKAGDEFDGATGALDANPSAWVPHDTACLRAQWDNGDPINAKEAAGILKHAHKAAGNNVRAVTWPIATYLFGCHAVRKNGWW